MLHVIFDVYVVDKSFWVSMVFNKFGHIWFFLAVNFVYVES